MFAVTAKLISGNIFMPVFAVTLSGVYLFPSVFCRKKLFSECE